MATAPHTALDHGTVVSPMETVLALSAFGECWKVLDGALDVFMTTFEQGESRGSLTHVARIEQGGAVFSLGPLSDSLVLLAKGTLGTRLLHHPAGSLADLLTAEETRRETGLMLQNWISKLTYSVSDGNPGGATKRIAGGDVFSSQTDAVALMPKQELIWIQVSSIATFLDAFVLPQVDGSAYFPVSRRGWIRANPNSDISAVDTEEILTFDPALEGLRAFRDAIGVALSRKKEAQAASERETLAGRERSDVHLFDLTLRKFGSPFRRSRVFRHEEEGSADPVFLACALVATAQGIDIRPPKAGLSSQPIRDRIWSIARASGIRVRQVTLKDQWWTFDGGHFVAFRDPDDSAVALLRKGNSYRLYDPASDATVRINETTAKVLAANAYLLYRPLPSRPLKPLDLLRFGFSGCKKELGTIILSGALSGLLGVVTPFAIGMIFDDLIPSARRTELMATAAFLLVIAVTMSMLNYAGAVASLRLQGRLKSSLQPAVWDRLMALPVPFFRRFTSGELAQKSMAVSSVQELVTGSTLTACLMTIFSSFSFFLLFYYSLPLALLALVLTLFAVLVNLLIGLFQFSKSKQSVLLQSRMSSLLVQLVSGVAKFRVSGSERRAFANWAKQFLALKSVAIETRSVGNIGYVFNNVYPVFCLAIIFYANVRINTAPNHAAMTTGDLIGFLAAFSQFLAVTLILGGVITQTVGILPVYENAKPILVSVPEVSPDSLSPGLLTGSIEISHVSFRYSADVGLALQDVSVKIQPGQFVAFVGASGSGKSTILRMLLGFDTPESGAVYFDERDLATLDLPALRRQLGVVLQSSRPLNGSILNNILRSSSLTLEDAWAAARIAGLHEDIRKMPMGMLTHISDGGGNLSGGQLQRLMIARAVASRPRILLFDEATSAVDNRTQELISQGLSELNSTRIVVAHRLSTVQDADCIHVVDKGRIVESGDYAYLMRNSERFASLVRGQLL